jgi:hypothetical protein
MDPADDPDLLIEGEGDPQNEDQDNELVADEWEPEEAQYQFDDKEDVTDDNTVMYRTGAIRVAPDDVAIMKVMADVAKPQRRTAQRNRCIIIGANTGRDLTGRAKRTVPSRGTGRSTA